VVCRTDPEAPPERAISIVAVEKPATGVILERVIDTPGYRAHLLPEFRLQDLPAPTENLLGEEGGDLRLVGASFLGPTALVGFMAVALMRAAFDHALRFARTKRRGGLVPILEHQAVGYALVDAKTSIEAVRALSLRACRAVDAESPAPPTRDGMRERPSFLVPIDARPKQYVNQAMKACVDRNAKGRSSEVAVWAPESPS
jgi:nitroalkane oxidase